MHHNPLTPPKPICITTSNLLLILAGNDNGDEEDDDVVRRWVLDTDPDPRWAEALQNARQIGDFIDDEVMH